MTDIFEAPVPFQPAEAPVEAPNGGGRHKRGPRRTTAAPAETPKRRGRPPGSSRPQTASPVAKRGRPAAPKAAVVPPPGADTNVDLHRIMGATVGLDENESKFVADVLHRLQSTDKRSRAKLAASLGRIFG